MSPTSKSTSKSGIQTSADGSSYIPSSTRADGSTRKEIRVRPGYRPPEDVETYKNRSAEAWKNRGSNGVPGAESSEKPSDSNEIKSKNAKRREAARKRLEAEEAAEASNETPGSATNQTSTPTQTCSQFDKEATAQATATEAEAERQKKIRNQLKKLRAVRDLKDKKANGEKLSHDQLLKIGKEEELLRDLKKLDYGGPEMSSTTVVSAG